MSVRHHCLCQNRCFFRFFLLLYCKAYHGFLVLLLIPVLKMPYFSCLLRLSIVLLNQKEAVPHFLLQKWLSSYYQVVESVMLQSWVLWLNNNRCNSCFLILSLFVSLCQLCVWFEEQVDFKCLDLLPLQPLPFVFKWSQKDNASQVDWKEANKTKRGKTFNS